MDRNGGGHRNQDPPPPPASPPPPLPPAYLENPHLQFSHRDRAPLLPTESRIAYTQGYFPRVVKSLDSLLSEINEVTTEAIKSHPDKFITLLVYGGGDKIKEENPNLMKDIQAFLQGLAIKGGEKLRVIDPPKKTNAQRGDFAKPHILLLQHGSPELRAFILWFQTFAFQIDGRKIAFSAVRFDINIRPWFITNITGQIIDDDPNMMTIAVETIKEHLSKDTAFRNHVNKVLTNREVGQSVLERKIIVLASFSLAFIPRATDEVEDTPVWQLAGCPVYDNMKDHRQWLKMIRRTDFHIGDMKYIRSTTEIIGCVWCKAETHSSEDCPLPRLEDWKGPIPTHDFVEPEPYYKPNAETKQRNEKRKARKEKARKSKGKKNPAREK
ncbi:hypothetical protein BDN71DRAFT_1560805 [Pleurotus eryngii]|uniref:Uncharacterized protein n=1 Tax=Pleurotus eryngii TaxID=5323 RepID=A0A9P6DGE0_PLEER|nr:hypothetical protein BDN71DRAFT_1560805 [Pleurotus eryngii]